jgi:hypothetical protein
MTNCITGLRGEDVLKLRWNRNQKLEEPEDGGARKG